MKSPVPDSDTMSDEQLRQWVETRFLEKLREEDNREWEELILFGTERRGIANALKLPPELVKVTEKESTYALARRELADESPTD